MKRFPGVVVGIVKSLDDPRGEGRIKVKFPWLPDLDEYPWAPVATPLTGGSRGMQFMPELEDEALVAFEHGDFDHPFIVGFLWNGVDRPPESEHKNRVILTPGGHTLRFEDADGSKKVILRSSHGHEIILDDTAPQKVTVQSKGGQKVVLNDGPATISIETKLKNKIEISDAPPGITISVPSGQVGINCLQANLSAATILNVTAPVAQFSGVGVASAVVSGAYNPAPGNTFGL